MQAVLCGFLSKRTEINAILPCPLEFTIDERMCRTYFQMPNVIDFLIAYRSLPGRDVCTNLNTSAKIMLAPLVDRELTLPHHRLGKPGKAPFIS